MSMNNVIPAWVIVVGQAQDDYKEGKISLEEAKRILKSVDAPEGCYEVLYKND